MKLHEALIFCNEAEKITTRKKTLTLFDAVAICEKFNRRVGENVRMMTESNKKLLVGNFDTLSPYMPNGSIYRTRWISLKGKSNHKIKDVDKFITEVLSNIDFATWYEDGKKLNFYSQSTNSLGETKYKQIGVAVKDRCATTAFVIPQSRYQSAYNNRIRK